MVHDDSVTATAALVIALPLLPFSLFSTFAEKLHVICFTCGVVGPSAELVDSSPGDGGARLHGCVREGGGRGEREREKETGPVGV